MFNPLPSPSPSGRGSKAGRVFVLSPLGRELERGDLLHQHFFRENTSKRRTDIRLRINIQNSFML